jgi:hypothetical protein
MRLRKQTPNLSNSQRGELFEVLCSKLHPAKRCVLPIDLDQRRGRHGGLIFTVDQRLSGHLGNVGQDGDVMMTVADDKGPAGSSKRHAESATGRIGDDVQRAKENISDAAASARDDIAADLRRLSADVTSLKDTVAALAKTVTAEVGEAATGIGGDIASAAKDQANTLLSEFEAVARRNPLGVVIGAFGIGILIGIMKGRR